MKEIIGINQKGLKNLKKQLRRITRKKYLECLNLFFDRYVSDIIERLQLQYEKSEGGAGGLEIEYSDSTTLGICYIGFQENEIIWNEN